MKNDLFIILILLLFTTSCERVETEGFHKFNSEKWKETNCDFTNYRKNVVYDLIYHNLHFFENGTRVKGVFDLLGEPLSIDSISNKYTYCLEIKDDNDSRDPYGGTNLQLTFDKDSTLIFWRINEYWYMP